MADKTKPKTSKPPGVEVFFDGRDSGYFYRIKNRFLKLGARDLRMHLRTLGLREDYCPSEWKAPGLREIDYPLWEAQMKRVVDYAGPLAGHRVGCFTYSSGRAILVTEEPSGIWDDLPAKPKRPKWFCDFVEELLPGDQSLDFFHWLRIALASLRRGDFRPGQVVVFAGPSECGKSLLQSIVTELFGGRSANPFRYMMAESQFNADLAWGEHWQIEDPASTTDIRTRRLFGSKLKECTVNRDFSIHQKGKDALLLPVFRRVTISVNDEPENLSVIPPLDDSIRDKIFLFKCSPVSAALAQFKDGQDNLDRKKLWESVCAEVPAIRAWLLNGLDKLPAALRNVRFGIKAWHHPDLLNELSNLSPESRLLTLLDEVLFDAADDAPFEGKAIEIEKALRDSKFAFEADKILKYNGACGAYLSRLCKSYPERISKRLSHGYTVWTITKPVTTEEESE